MFGLFKTKPPLSPWEKAWTEYRMSWFAEQLGVERILESDTLRLNDERLPNVVNYDDAVLMLKFLGTWMRVDTSDIRLKLHAEVVAPETLATYSGQSGVVLEIHEDQLEDRAALVATIAWQLANCVISSGQLKNVKLSDQAWTTDLLPVFLGVGIFGANQTLRDMKKEADHFAWWGPKQRAYLSARIFGYALALRANVRGEDVSDWCGSLRQDAEVSLHDGLKYLQKTGDSVFSRESLRTPRSDMLLDSLLDELETGSASRKISAMWELSTRADEKKLDQHGHAGELLAMAVRHKHPEVRAVGAATLPLYDWSAEAVQVIVDALKDSHDDVRVSAAGALGRLVGVDDQFVVESLTDALNDDVRLVVFNAARSLVNFGTLAQDSTEALLRRLRQSLVDCRDGDAHTILWAIDSIADDSRALIQDFFADDQEYQKFSLDLLEQVSS